MIRRWNVVLTAALPSIPVRRTQPLPMIPAKKTRIIRPATILAAGLSLSA